MKPEPYTNEEIIEILPRLAARNQHAAWQLAADIFPMNRDEMRIVDGRPIWSVTIPLPPKRRPLKNDELPDEFAIKSGGRFYNYKNRPYSAEIYSGWDTEHVQWREIGGVNWKQFYIDEPQPPLVITTE